MNQKISTALKTEQEKDTSTSTETVELLSDDNSIKTSKIVTTVQEIESYYIIKGMLSSIINIERITYRDAERYFSIFIDDNNRKPVCRLNLDTKKMQILFPDENKTFERVYIDSLNDIYKYKDRLINIAQKYI